MKRNILNKLAICLLLLSAFGCRVRKPVTPVIVSTPSGTQASQPQTAVNSQKIFTKIDSSQLKFKTLSLKAKADIGINNNSNSVTMNIRMQNAKVIWVSVTAPIIGEVARALITPDSLKIINKLEDSYIRKPFSYIYQYVDNQISFQSLQNLFVGNAFEGTLSPQAIVRLNGGQTQVSGVLTDLTYLLIFNEANNLLQSNLADKAAGQSLSANYGDYKELARQSFPYAVSMRSAVANKEISLDMQYIQVNIDEALDFPFTVPKRFSVKD